jgi:Xaa-Pro aminopeptidase
MWQQRILDAWQGVKGQLRRGVVAPESLYDLMPLLSEMRLFKSQAEIQLMQRAIQVSVSGHQRAMRASMRAQYEYELEAELLDEFTRKGCRDLAYGSIVAGGSHACVLHYTDNNKPLKPGELVLIDAGAEYQNYAADITRTFPLNGHFSSEQRSIYELVLRAQQAGIACVKPGCAWDVIQSTMVQILTEGLLGHFLIEGHEAWLPFMLVVASSSYVYVALADLIPQLQKRLTAPATAMQVLWLFAGIALVTAATELMHVH